MQVVKIMSKRHMPVYLKFFDWQILRSGRIYKSSLFEDDHSYYLTPFKSSSWLAGNASCGFCPSLRHRQLAGAAAGLSPWQCLLT